MHFSALAPILSLALFSGRALTQKFIYPPAADSQYQADIHVTQGDTINATWESDFPVQLWACGTVYIDGYGWSYQCMTEVPKGWDPLYPEKSWTVVQALDDWGICRPDTRKDPNATATCWLSAVNWRPINNPSDPDVPFSIEFRSQNFTVHAPEVHIRT